MRKLALLLVVIAATLALAACGGSEDSAESEPESGSEQSYANPFQEMEMDASAQAALTGLPPYIEGYVARAVEDGRAEGDEYLDVTGIEPVFVGYEVNAWEPIEGTGEVQWYEVTYMNDHISFGYATPDEERTKMPEPDTGIASNTRGMPADPSAGELAAVEAAQAKLAEFSEEADSWEYGVKRYLFLYEKDGVGLVIGMTADGELGSNSMPFEFGG